MVTKTSETMAVTVFGPSSSLAARTRRCWSVARSYAGSGGGTESEAASTRFVGVGGEDIASAVEDATTLGGARAPDCPRAEAPV